MANKQSRKELAAEIVTAVENLLDEASRRVGGEDASRYHCNRAEVGALSISRCSPVVSTDGRVHRSAVINIWTTNNGRSAKVFSADTSPLCLIGIQKGTWIEELVPGASAAG